MNLKTAMASREGRKGRKAGSPLFSVDPRFGKAPTSKHQAPENIQTPITKLTFNQSGAAFAQSGFRSAITAYTRTDWNLVLGASLELGCWGLVLRFKPNPHAFHGSTGNSGEPLCTAKKIFEGNDSLNRAVVSEATEMLFKNLMPMIRNCGEPLVLRVSSIFGRTFVSTLQ